MPKGQKTAVGHTAPGENYAKAVKEAVAKLLDHTHARKWNTLELDTDEDYPFVHAWVPPHDVKIHGSTREGWESPPEGETWSFLECCEKALAAIERHAKR